MIKIASDDREILNCFGVMADLRPHLEQERFVETVRELAVDGYRLAYIAHENQVVAVAGYRIYSNLFMGKHLYVDDLVTAENARSQGLGKQMIDWLRNHAIENSCKVLHLDSGTHRHNAHKFYLNQGFAIASFHFSQSLS